MRLIVVFLLACLAVIAGRSQSIITKSIYPSQGPFGNYQVFKINALKGRLNNGKFERALEQNDVIGNDYQNDQRIFGINANHDDSYTPTNYHPVEGSSDGFKRTFCGSLHAYYYGGNNWYAPINDFFDRNVDRDQCIELELDKNNPLLKRYEYLYKQYDTMVTFPGTVLRNRFFQPWNIIEGEVNTGRREAEFSFSDLQSPVCLYGPWVFELYDPSEYLTSHGNNNEIHPIEQSWYKNKPVKEGNTSYRLNFFVDASNRFNDKDDYYGIQTWQEPLFKPWSAAPMNGKFYLAFEINLKQKESLTYWIEAIDHFALKPQTDGRNHLLMRGNDTLVRIYESNEESVSIDFDNVGYKPLKGNRYDSSILQGFIVLSSRIEGVLGIDAGSLQLRVEKQTSSTLPQTLVFSVEKIQRLHSNSFRHYNPVTGITYSSPENSFNEKQVFMALSSGEKTASQSLSLDSGQTVSTNHFQVMRKGHKGEEYRFEINCHNGANGPNLGRLVVSGKEPIKNSTSRTTILEYAIHVDDQNSRVSGGEHANPVLRVALFSITYTIKVIPESVNQGMGH